VARVDTEFIVKRRDRLNTIIDLQTAIGASEKGKEVPRKFPYWLDRN